MSLKHDYVNQIVSANWDYEIQQINKQIAERKRKIIAIEKEIQKIDKKLKRLKNFEKTIDKFLCWVYN